MALLGSNQPMNKFRTGQAAQPTPGQTAAQQPVQPQNTGKVDRGQKDAVLFGNELKHVAPDLQVNDPVLYFKGTDKEGNHKNIPISNSVLSRHFMLLGGIGTGKTNTFFQIVSQVKENMTENDVWLISHCH